MDQGYENLLEDEVSVSPIMFRLDSVETDVVDLVRKLCDPSFVAFDFAVPDDTCRRIIDKFLEGRIGSAR